MKNLQYSNLPIVKTVFTNVSILYSKGFTRVQKSLYSVAFNFSSIIFNIMQSAVNTE